MTLCNCRGKKAIRSLSSGQYCSSFKCNAGKTTRSELFQSPGSYQPYQPPSSLSSYQPYQPSSTSHTNHLHPSAATSHTSHLLPAIPTTFIPQQLPAIPTIFYQPYQPPSSLSSCQSFQPSSTNHTSHLHLAAATNHLKPKNFRRKATQHCKTKVEMLRGTVSTFYGIIRVELPASQYKTFA